MCVMPLMEGYKYIIVNDFVKYVHPLIDGIKAIDPDAKVKYILAKDHIRILAFKSQVLDQHGHIDLLISDLEKGTDQVFSRYILSITLTKEEHRSQFRIVDRYEFARRLNRHDYYSNKNTVVHFCLNEKRAQSCTVFGECDKAWTYTGDDSSAVSVLSTYFADPESPYYDPSKSKDYAA